MKTFLCVFRTFRKLNIPIDYNLVEFWLGQVSKKRRLRDEFRLTLNWLNK